ncbi:Mss4-like protein [Neohortaea acidophila]|uniref:Mss4-like protein n=1 Tax=Neohortaea acidophila TaxID=245834 RepID=A0A6A6Q645_9PEZI|nr:Mss4-like protein [Neohortaea acidophila]KAF2487541.1 Mss4-like protein [Neohortaea acidophila]
MSDGYETVTARCLCGVARHQLELAKADLPLRLSICHCHSCRHMTGTLGLTFIQLAADYAPAPAVLANLTAFPFSKRLTQYFCSTCGTLMLSHYWKDGDDRSKGEQWDAMTGTLEQADGIFELQSHEFVADTLDGGQADFLPSVNGKAISRWAGWPGKSEQLPLYWTSPNRPSIRESRAEKVHAHCKCGGVQFWIARPSERSEQASCPWPDLIIPDHSTEARPAPAAWWLCDGGKKFLAGVCACNSCRLDTGMEWMPWAFVPAIDITLDAEGDVPFSLPFSTLRAYTSSPHVIRWSY